MATPLQIARSMLDIVSISKTASALLALLISASVALAETSVTGGVAETLLAGRVDETNLANGAPPPSRVVSVNLCTDQLAMMLAGPKQLVSVSYLARDPMSSAMAEEAKNYPINHGQIEEIIMLKPDLVLAQEWTSPVLLAMLDQFKIPYIKFKAAQKLDDIIPEIIKMGEALGQGERANQMALEFQKRRDAIIKNLPKINERPSIASYGPNGWVGGSQTLAADVFRLTGFDNIADRTGLEYGGFLSLEKLIIENPDVILMSSPYPGSSRGEALLAHPAIKSLSGKLIKSPAQDAAWDCGTPLVLNAVEAMSKLANDLQIGAKS